MKKIFLIMSLVMAFSCGHKNKNSVDKNKKIEKNTTTTEQVKQNQQEEKTDFDKLSKKEQEEYLKKLEKI